MSSGYLSTDHKAGGGIFINSGQSNVFNCTIAYNTNQGLRCETGTSTIKNSILYFNTPDKEQISGNVTANYSDVQFGYQGEGNIDFHPVFFSKTDVKIVFGSPCIDKGDSTPSFNDICFPPSLGTQRNDMGAHGGPGACKWLTLEPPKNLKARAGDRQVTLMWEANKESYFQRYLIFGGTAANPTTQVDFVEGAANTTKTITGLNNGTTYYFRLKAVDNAMQQSGFSNEVRATPPANLPPVVTNTISNQIVTLRGASFVRNLEASPPIFQDPEGLTLSYTASSSASNTVTATISGTTLTVTAVAAGTATITVTADDGNDGKTSTPFTATVNQPPVVSNAIVAQTLQLGGASFTRNLTAAPVVFTDPDGDALTFTASSSATNIATAAISGSTLTVTPVAGGSATITVTASDGKGGTVSTMFTAAVNRPPVVANAIPNQTIMLNGTPFARNLSASPVVFTDPDGDALTYSAASKTTNIVTTSLSGSTLTVAPVAAGRDTITVTANDGKGGTAQAKFAVTVNRPPTVASTIPNQTLTVGGPAFTRNLIASPAIFNDPDGDALSYTASSNATNIATASISNSTLTVAPVAVGNATITVTANDNKGGTVPATFTVTVGTVSNRPPVVVIAFSPIILIVGGVPYTRDLNAPPVFTDPDNDVLTYTASSSVTNVAPASIVGSTLTVTPVAAGSAFITVTANDGKGGSAQTTLLITVNVDSESPKILTVDAVPIVDFGSPIVVLTTVTDNVAVREVRLLYHEGGQSSFVTIKMDSIGSSYRQTIPGTVVGTRGVEFYIEAFDPVNNRKASNLQSVRVRLPDKHLSKAQAGGSAENAYRLISVPIENNNPDLASILLDDLGTADTTKWRIWDINPQTAESDFPYREYPAVGPLLPGKSIFLITKENKTLTSGAGATVITTEPFKIDLKPGWNKVAIPFNFDIPIENVKPDSLRDDLYAYNGAFVSSLNFLKPWEGYMIKVKAPVTLTIQPSEIPQSVIAKAVVAPDWFLRVQATCERARDVDNVIGVVQDAATEWDPYERFEPPPIGKYVMVSFPHREWQRYPDVYTTDFRPPSSDGHAWDFAVSSNISGKPVMLRFDHLESLPPEYEIKLVDLSLKLAQDLRREAQYVFRSNSSESKKTFRLLIGKTDFIAERSVSATAAPATYELAPNFPNPFNPSTSIKFGLPEKSRVSLRIYNLLGKEVATLFDDVEKEAGYHAAIWEGKDRQGNAMPSGIYIYRLIIGNVVLTKKMTLIK